MAATVAAGWPYSSSATSSSNGRLSTTIAPKSPTQSQVQSLQSSMTSLSLSGSAASSIKSPVSSTASLSMSVNSDELTGLGTANGSSSGGQKPIPLRSPSLTSGQPLLSAIGSGRSGTSPPSRSNVGGYEPSSLGSTNGTALSSIPTSANISSRNLPWPSSAGADGESRLNTNHPNNQDGHHDLPGLAGNDEAASRFALSQPQFVLDHAQLAKSREQRDLDDVDSGQRASATLWMGDLEGWMDETYIRRCISALGWDRDENGNQTIQTNVKMIKGASSTSGYCFITFPTSAHAQSVLAHFSKQPPMLMPGSERTFKLNWATGLPGVQPKWEGEYSVFVGDLGREVTEGELVSLFTPLFPSTKSAKIMYDPTTGLSRGYGFVRFGDENDMQRSLALGQNSAGSGLSLRGRTLRISEASGSGGASRTRTSSGEAGSANLLDGNGGKQARDLHIQVPGGALGSVPDAKSPYTNGSNASLFSERHHSSGLTSPNLLSPNATGFSIPVSSPASPGKGSPFSNASSLNPMIPTGPLSPSTDPNNTTVFVGGLPACINEETLKSFFQHFGDITYVKIPPNKGCGFVQFVRRPDAELAIAKMHDFPIHGKSRIRLSWGRSQNDKQVEHVRKLANALNVPFEAVWRMVQGQDNSTIKQIASAVGGNGAHSRRGGPEAEAVRADLARLTGFGAQNGSALPEGILQRAALYDNNAVATPLPHPASNGPVIKGPELDGYAFRPAVPAALSPEQFGWAGPPRDQGPYSRVSPSVFAPMSTSNLGGHPQQTVPLSPAPTAGVYSHPSFTGQLGASLGRSSAPLASDGGFGGPYSPYTPIQIPSPVNMNSSVGPGSDSGLNGSFDPRSWKHSSKTDILNDGSSTPDFLTNAGATAAANARASGAFDDAF